MLKPIDLSHAQAIALIKHFESTLGLKILPDTKKYNQWSVKKVDTADYGSFNVAKELTLEEYIHIQNVATCFENSGGNNISDTAVRLIVEAIFAPHTITPANHSGCRIAKEMLRYKSDDYNDLIEPNPIDGYTGSNYPRAYVPTKKHIKPKLAKLKISDVLSIFPESEQKAFALGIGRMLCGHSSQRYAHNTDAKYNTPWRYMMLISGPPAIGKSYLMEQLLAASEALGYTKSEFTNLNKQFGVADIIDKDVAYSDDLSSTTLANLLGSVTFKSIVSGAVVRTEAKNVAEEETQAKALFVANINKFDSSVLHSIDEGAINRLLVLKTYSNYQLKSVKQKGLSAKSPYRGTFQHFEWLRETYDVTNQDIFNAFFRLCVDMYLAEVKAGTLRDTVEVLKSYFQFQPPVGTHTNFVKLLQLSLMTLNQSTKEAYLPPALTGVSLQESIIAINYLVNSNEAYRLRSLIKEDWLAKGRVGDHPWQVLKTLNMASIYDAASIAIVADSKQLIDSSKAIKSLLSDIRFEDSFKVTSDMAAISSAWSETRLSLTSEFAGVIKEAKELNLEATPKFNIEHLFTPDFDRESWAKKLASR